MATDHRPPRGLLAPDDIRDPIARLVRTIGARAAARRLGLSREQVLSIAAGAPVTMGTVVQAREALSREAA